MLKIDFLRDKIQVMRSKSPEGIDQELYAALVGCRLTRQLVHSVAAEHGLCRISHTGALTEARFSLITHASIRTHIDWPEVGHPPPPVTRP